MSFNTTVLSYQCEKMIGPDVYISLQGKYLRESFSSRTNSEVTFKNHEFQLMIHSICSIYNRRRLKERPDAQPIVLNKAY